jgi:hypothetical protein
MPPYSIPVSDETGPLDCELICAMIFSLLSVFFFKSFNSNMIDIIITHVPILNKFQHIIDNTIINNYQLGDNLLKEDLEKEHNKKFSFSDSGFPNAVYGYEHGICLPVYPTLSRNEVKSITHTIREAPSEVNKCIIERHSLAFMDSNSPSKAKWYLRD